MGRARWAGPGGQGQVSKIRLARVRLIKWDKLAKTFKNLKPKGQKTLKDWAKPANSQTYYLTGIRRLKREPGQARALAKINRELAG